MTPGCDVTDNGDRSREHQPISGRKHWPALLPAPFSVARREAGKPWLEWDSADRERAIWLPGNVGGAWRIGTTVHRPVGPWTTSVHSLLAFLAERGVPHVPQVLGFDEQGREVLTSAG